MKLHHQTTNTLTTESDSGKNYTIFCANLSAKNLPDSATDAEMQLKQYLNTKPSRCPLPCRDFDVIAKKMGVEILRKLKKYFLTPFDRHLCVDRSDFFRLSCIQSNPHFFLSIFLIFENKIRAKSWGCSQYNSQQIFTICDFSQKIVSNLVMVYKVYENVSQNSSWLGLC